MPCASSTCAIPRSAAALRPPSNAEQNKVFQPHAGRRIVLATNVAETSLTVPGIRYVIDPGTATISRYSWRTKVQRLPIEPVSQASANQRKGRCGRVADGICIRLYSRRISIAVLPLPTPRSCAPTWPRSSCRCWRSALAIWRRSPSSSHPSRAISRMA
ncbi:helicase-related protein [Escherichia coli]